MARRRKKRSGGVLFLAVFLVMIAFILFKFVFVIRNVEVTGSASLTATDIARAADLDYGGSIFLCNDKEITRGVEELGEVELISVKKKYPSTVIIEVRQRTSAAVIVHQNEIIRLDENGYVLGTSDGFPAGSIYVTGMHVTSCRKGTQIAAGNGQLAAMTACVNALHAAGGVKYVSQLDLENIKDIQIIATNKTRVRVGNTDKIDAKMAWFTAAIADLSERGQRGGTLDVTSATKADYIPTRQGTE